MPAEPGPDERLAGPAGVDASVNAPAPDAPLPDGYLDLYKLAVEMADRISARRGLTNSFFLTINTAVVGVLGTQSSRWYFAVAGITLSVAWWASLVSYRNLNAAKFEVITSMEQRLPRQIYEEEWTLLSSHRGPAGPDSPPYRSRISKYRELGWVERVVPLVFVLLYIGELVRQAAS
jgi:hypothetical protein